MKDVLQRVTDNFNARYKELEQNLEEQKDWKILDRVLHLEEMQCYDLFRKVNHSLEDVRTLYSMMVNCLLDDSSFKIDIVGSGWYAALYVNWGNDDCPRVDEEDLHKMIDILEAKYKFAEDNKEQLNKFNIYDRTVWNEYSKFKTDLEDLMLSLASEDVQKEYKKRKNSKKNNTN
jgi:hypothetical protein